MRNILLTIDVIVKGNESGNHADSLLNGQIGYVIGVIVVVLLLFYLILSLLKPQKF